MSKLGFDRSIRQLNRVKKEFLTGAIRLARKEFNDNFKGEKNSETGKDWDAVLRGYPPPILDVTGELRAQAVKGGNLTITTEKAVLVIDPIDKRGRGYAQYHQDGIDVHERAFVTQSNNLTAEQEKLLDNKFEDII